MDPGLRRDDATDIWSHRIHPRRTCLSRDQLSRYERATEGLSRSTTTFSALPRCAAYVKVAARDRRRARVRVDHDYLVVCGLEIAVDQTLTPPATRSPAHSAAMPGLFAIGDDLHVHAPLVCANEGTRDVRSVSCRRASSLRVRFIDLADDESVVRSPGVKATSIVPVAGSARRGRVSRATFATIEVTSTTTPNK